MLPHLGAAFNLARWLTRNDHDAEDVLQEAMMRAYRYFDSLRGEARPWLLAIVRNACFTWLRSNRPAEIVASLEDEKEQASEAEGPEALTARATLPQMPAFQPTGPTVVPASVESPR